MKNLMNCHIAITLDNRSIIKMFYNILIQKIEFINLFCGKEKIKIILVCEYILSFLFNFFLMHFYILMKLFQINTIIMENWIFL